MLRFAVRWQKMLLKVKKWGNSSAIIRPHTNPSQIFLSSKCPNEVWKRDQYKPFSWWHHQLLKSKHHILLLSGVNIQSVTHDSAEDALTALRLYRKYEELKKQGEQSFRSTLRQLYEAGRKCSWKVEDLPAELWCIIGSKPVLIYEGKNKSIQTRILCPFHLHLSQSWRKSLKLRWICVLNLQLSNRLPILPQGKMIKVQNSFGLQHSAFLRVEYTLVVNVLVLSDRYFTTHLFLKNIYVYFHINIITCCIV